MLTESAPNSNLDAAGLDAEVPDSKTISLTPEQLSALSVADCLPGQIYNIQLECGGDANGPAPAGDTGKEGADGAASDLNAPKLFTVISSTTETPDEAPPSSDEAELTAPEDVESPEDKVLGFSRKKKSPRSGLPDTKSMRDM